MAQAGRRQQEASLRQDRVTRISKYMVERWEKKRTGAVCALWRERIWGKTVMKNSLLWETALPPEDMLMSHSVLPLRAMSESRVLAQPRSVLMSVTIVTTNSLLEVIGLGYRLKPCWFLSAALTWPHPLPTAFIRCLGSADLMPPLTEVPSWPW